MQLANVDQPLTMSSREIAELTQKRHDNVLVTIRSLIGNNILSPEIQELETEYRGRTIPYFEFNKRDSLVVVARLSPEFTAAVIDRWQELENKQSLALPDFSNPAEAARAWANEFEAKQIAEQRLIEAQPKVAFVDNLVDRKNLLTATQVAQKHGISAIKLNKILSELKVYNRAVKRTKVFQQWFVDKGYGEMKKTELGYDQPLFTNSGEIWINEKLISEGIV
jgi:phage regulator Rha-like protein